MSQRPISASEALESYNENPNLRATSEALGLSLGHTIHLISRGLQERRIIEDQMKKYKVGLRD